MTEERQVWQVVFYTDSRGNSPVIAFLNELPAHERAEIANAFRLL